jgi:hypothetical protein
MGTKSNIASLLGKIKRQFNIFFKSDNPNVINAFPNIRYILNFVVVDFRSCLRIGFSPV